MVTWSGISSQELQKCNWLCVNKWTAESVLSSDMKTSGVPSPGLTKGQLWKIEHGYVLIVEIGNRLVHYKMLRHPGQKAVMTRLIGIDALAVYLRHNEAELVNGPEVLVA
jgi:hypothetical protein